MTPAKAPHLHHADDVTQAFGVDPSAGLHPDEALRRGAAHGMNRIELDLTRAAFDNPIPGLSKPAGRPGRAPLPAKPSHLGGVVDDRPQYCAAP